MNFKLALKIAALGLLGLAPARADNIFVTNFGINTITKYDANGSGSLFTNAFVNGPYGIALDASGNVYVSTNNNTIEKFSPNGTDLGVFASTGLNLTMGLAFDATGNLYAANFAGNTVRKFSPNGTDLGIFAIVTRPTGLAFDAAGNLYVANIGTTIQRFSPNGTPLTPFTSLALNNPEGLAFDSLGFLYAANNGSNTIQVFSPTGVDLGSISTATAAAEHGVSAPTPAPTPASATQNVYIAYRTDGLAGDGSLHNPFDGSTQPKLDAIFKSFYDASTTDITFHLGPGTFQMKGAWDYDWALLSGWHIKGSGRTATIVQQVAGAAGVNPGSNGALFGNGWALNYDNQSVEDLTCDCAWFRSGPGGDNSRPHGNFQGINLWGANPTIRNVTVTGCGWQDGECFAILTSGDDQHLPDNALYENVEVSGGSTGPFSTHLTGMAMVNLGAMGTDPTPVFAKNGRIINCTFNLPDAGNAGGPPAGYDGGIVTGCTFIGYHHGVFYDTFTSKNIAIVGNTIKALYPDSDGVLFNAGVNSTASENISVVGNTIFASSGVAFASAVRNSTIAGNRIRLAPGNHANSSVFLDTASVRSIRVAQNNIDPGIPCVSNAAGCTFRANRLPTGGAAIPDTAGVSGNSTTDYAAVSAPSSSGLSGPIGLAFDSDDNLYAVNSLAATITKFSPGGSATTFATTGFSPAFIAVQKAPTLVNISTRLNILTGDNVLDAGFIISGSGTKRVLIRGLGPELADLGVEGTLADPLIQLYDASNTLVAENDNWKTSQQSEIAATGLAPSNDAEAALITTLSAGSYTVIERGKLDTTGIGLVEVYDLGAGFGPELGNISTRGFVDTGTGVMIAGFVAASSTGGSGQVLVRGIGPSLGNLGIADPLADPTLELRDVNGALVAANDNWKSDQQAAIEATNLAPGNDAEAALIATVTPGSYTAIESGVNGGTGVGLVEVYNLH